jgi:hypothetical protein
VDVGRGRVGSGCAILHLPAVEVGICRWVCLLACAHKEAAPWGSMAGCTRQGSLAVQPRRGWRKAEVEVGAEEDVEMEDVQQGVASGRLLGEGGSRRKRLCRLKLGQRIDQSYA